MLLSKAISFVLLISLITACSTSDRVDLGKHVSGPLKLSVGDIIRVVTVDIEDFRFRFTGITEQAIEGENISIPFVEIRDIEVITPVRYSSEDISDISTSVILVIITAAGIILADSPTGGTTYTDVFPH